MTVIRNTALSSWLTSRYLPDMVFSLCMLCPACMRAAIVYEVIDLGTLGGAESLAWLQIGRS